MKQRVIQILCELTMPFTGYTMMAWINGYILEPLFGRFVYYDGLEHLYRIGRAREAKSDE